ncbi:Thiol:disulfide interchange protein DsbA [Rubrivivax sp. A210]|uniref:thiol:disulfide interchange protein DsbA/DsbL n=1 Tax=Rubrivivax sp. A210 TaxID=2772301 RepID=UPI00191AC3D3|nr:thiol:disulfide interchange protein DsbA/DsbL [Rubrivivax sp. A210]CAD5373125.1 Thiol:disulfide interchange protein DsbA [Rubrivivax sp. A210]
MQRRDFSLQLAAAGLGLGLAGGARAQAVAPVEGQHYVRLATPVAVALPAADKKIEVVEFFWYGCPHCFAFEPVLDNWTRKLPADVAFRRVPVGFAVPHQLHQRVYYALEEMGVLAAQHRRIFTAIHQQNVRLNTEAEIVAYMKGNGVDAARFTEALKSFGVSGKAAKARALSEAYKIDGVPALGIHGRFYTSASLSGSHENTVAVADVLIQRARKPT